MAVFHKTESLVMSPVQRFHCYRQKGRACGRQQRQDETSAMGWNERCVVLLYVQQYRTIQCNGMLHRSERNGETKESLESDAQILTVCIVTRDAHMHTLGKIYARKSKARKMTRKAAIREF